MTGYEIRIGLEIHVGTGNQHQDLLRLCRGVRRAAQFPVLPRLLGLAGKLASAKPGRGGVCHSGGFGP